MLSRRELLARTSSLLGMAVTGSLASAVLAGCRGESRLDWTPVFFNGPEARTVGAMVDHLLPKTSTPGALEMEVDRFIDAFLYDYATTEEQRAFAEGLAAFDATCQSQFGGAFAGLGSAARDRVFQHFEEQSPGLAPTVWGSQTQAAVEPPTFYRRFKQLALVGYFTSPVVGQTVLAYDPIPGRFDGCIPLSSVGKAWSL